MPGLTASDAKTLLVEWTKFMLDINNNPGVPATSHSIDAANLGRSTYLVPGSWGHTGMQWTIRPQGRKLFIVCGSSHATFPELPPSLQRKPESLQTYAQAVDDAWLHTTALYIDAGTTERIALTTVTTDVFKVNIDAAHPYATGTSPTVHGNNVEMVTVGRVALLDAQLDSRLVIAAQCPEIDVMGKREQEYNMHVAFDIK